VKEKIVFFGAGPYVVPVIDLLNKNFDLIFVVTTENENGPVPKFCKENKIEYVSIREFSNDLKSRILSLKTKVAVLASFGVILPEDVLNIFPLGIINIHPSLLPKYRGPTPVQTAILNGDKTTGVSIIKLDNEIDHGPILTQDEEKIESEDTGESLYLQLFKIGGELLLDVLPKYISGDLKLKEQNHDNATYTERDLSRDSGLIDINNPPEPQKIKQMVNAYFPWPGVWFKAILSGKEKVIKLLPQEKIQVEGKNIMTLKDFANGYSQGKEILLKLNLNG